MGEPNTALKAGPGQDPRWNTYGVGQPVLPTCPLSNPVPDKSRTNPRGTPYPARNRRYAGTPTGRS